MESFGKPSETLTIGSLTVVASQGKLAGPRGTGRLEPRVMELLVYLARHDGAVVTRDAIIRDVWRDTQVTDAVISRSIHEIRKLLAKLGGDASWIETIPKRGYRLVYPTPDAAATVPLATREAPARKHRAWWIAAAAVGVLTAALPVLVGVRHAPAAPTMSNAERTSRGLLVLPITDSTPAGKDESLAAGLTDELIAEFSRVGGLRVIGFGSASRVAARGATPGANGRDLGVGTVLTAVVRQEGGRILLSTRLIDAGSNAVLAEQVYESPAEGIPTLSSIVVRDVARRLEVEAPEPDAATHPATRSAAAYRLYLQGRAYALQNQAGAYQQAADYFRQATTEDPHFAAAIAATAISELLQVDMGNRPAAEAAHAAGPLVEEALRLDPQLPEAQAAAGLMALYQQDFTRAATALRRATSLRPSYSQAQIWLGRLAMREWQVGRAVASFQRARDIDPLSPIVLLNSGLALDLAGHWDAAAESLSRGIEVAPGFPNLHWALGHVRWEQGDLAQAERLYAKAIELGGDYSTLYSQYAVLLADRGRAAEGGQWITRAARMDPADEWLFIAALTSAMPAEVPASPTDGTASGNPRVDLLNAELAANRGDFGRARRLLNSLDLSDPATQRLMHSGWLAQAGHLPLLDVAAIYLRSGDEPRGRQLLADARSYLTDLKKQGLDSAGMDYSDAAAAALSGDRPQAMLALRSAATRHWRELPTASHDLKLAALRGDPRFTELVGVSN